MSTHTPKYILVDKTALSVTLEVGRRDSAFAVPIQLSRSSRPLSPLEKAIYDEVLYPAIHAEDRRKGVKAAYWLIEPEPWHIAIAYIMWEGIVQGMTWDAVKVLVQHALATLRSHRLAPPQSTDTMSKSEQKKVESETEIGLVWDEYANDGRKRYHMFIGLRRVYYKKTKSERNAVSRSVVKDRKV